MYLHNLFFILKVQEIMMLGAFFINSSKRHLPNSMQADRHYSDSWLHLFTVISTMMRKGYADMLWDIKSPTIQRNFDHPTRYSENNVL